MRNLSWTNSLEARRIYPSAKIVWSSVVTIRGLLCQTDGVRAFQKFRLGAWSTASSTPNLTPPTHFSEQIYTTSCQDFCTSILKFCNRFPFLFHLFPFIFCLAFFRPRERSANNAVNDISTLIILSQPRPSAGKKQNILCYQSIASESHQMDTLIPLPVILTQKQKGQLNV